jgi:hypothetical protein
VHSPMTFTAPASLDLRSDFRKLHSSLLLFSQYETEEICPSFPAFCRSGMICYFFHNIVLGEYLGELGVSQRN